MRTSEVVEKTRNDMNIPGFCYLSEEIGRPNGILKEGVVVGQAEGTG